MRRLFRDEALHQRLEASGWAPLPSLAPPAIDALRQVAEEVKAALVHHAGFDELWGNEDSALRDRGEERIAHALGGFLRDTFEGFRPVLYNLFVKRAHAPGSAVRYHQDFAIIDERGGDAALQLWIPLVDATKDNGALVVVEGSHLDASWKRPTGSRHPLHDASLVDLPPGAVSLPFLAGYGVAFSNRTAHGSPANVSPDDRIAVGCVLAPEDTPLVHLVQKDDGSVEVWAFDDEDLRALRPGWFPPSARLVEVVPKGSGTAEAYHF